MERDAGAEQALARLRVDHTLTRPQLARLSGLAVSTITRAEAGLPMSPATIRALARVLGPQVHTVVPVKGKPRHEPRTANPSNIVAQSRLDRGWTQQQAAHRIGVSPDVLARAESGEGVHPANAAKIAAAYGLDVFDVIPLRKANDPAMA